jgi:hypothetical protein
MMGLPADDLEALWEKLATAIDEAGERDKVFLAKLALLMAQEIGDRKRIEEMIGIAQTDL